MKKIKILMIVDSLNKCDGIASYVMNYYQNINFEKYHVDFLVSKFNDNLSHEYKEIIEKNKGNIFLKTNLSNFGMVKEIFKINNFFKNRTYDIVHCHILNMGYFYLKSAKKNGVQVRILHSHATFLWSKNVIKNVRNQIFKSKAVKMSNVYFACSNMAGTFLFKNKKYFLVKNAIEIEKYSYKETKRIEIRNELNIDNYKVIGHIGRLNVQKNHKFLIELFKSLYEIDSQFRLLLVGDGELRKELEDQVERLNLQNVVFFLGVRDDVHRILQGIDLLLMPSLFEGLPVAGIEAQASDLQCIFADTITKETKLLEKTKFLSLDKIDIWKDEILKMDIKNLSRKNVENIIIEKGYEIKSATKYLENLYESLLKGDTNEN